MSEPETQSSVSRSHRDHDPWKEHKIGKSRQNVVWDIEQRPAEGWGFILHGVDDVQNSHLWFTIESGLVCRCDDFLEDLQQLVVELVEVEDDIQNKTWKMLAVSEEDEQSWWKLKM